MSERDLFDTGADARVAALFAESPTLMDADTFAARVEARLDRRYRLRRLLLSTAALAGGGLAAAQAASEGLAVRLAQLGHGGLAWMQAEPKRFIDTAGGGLEPLSVALGALPPLHGLVAPSQFGWLTAAGAAAVIVTALQAREPA